MDINEYTIKIINNKFFYLFNSIFPGIFIMEIFFKKGLFNEIPQSIYEFLIFVVWCFLFSIPYNILSAFSFNKIIEKIKKKALKDETIDKEKFLAEFQKYVDTEQEENKRVDSLLKFFYILIEIFLTYMIYKVLTYFYVYHSVLKININLLIFINTIFILFAIHLIIIRPLTNYLENLIVKRKFS